MARCGCNNVCSCLVQGDGTTATVSGNGTSANPYIVSAVPQGQLTVVDTGSVDHTLTGTGTTGDPYVLSSVVKPSTDANNCFVLGSDGGAFVPCPDGSETIVQGDGLTTAVTGSGTAADPYIVTSVGGGGGGVVASGNGTTVTGTGTAGDPYLPNVDTGCGLEVVADLVQANVAAWPFACPQDANAQDVYCSPTTGQLQAAPEKMVQTAYTPLAATQTLVLAGLGSCVGVQNVSTNLGAMVFTNPDPCRSMTVLLEIGGRVRIDVDMDNFDDNVTVFNINARTLYQVNGGGFLLYRNDTFGHDPSALQDPITVVGGNGEQLAPHIVIPPGGVATIDTRLEYTCSGPGSIEAQIVWNNPSVRATGWSI